MLVCLDKGDDPVTEPLPLSIHPEYFVDIALFAKKALPNHLHIVDEIFFRAEHLLYIGTRIAPLFCENSVFQLVLHFVEEEVCVAKALSDLERMLVHFGG